MAITATTEDRATDVAAKGITAAVFIYIVAAALALGAQALNIPALADTITGLLIVATITASVGTAAMWTAIIIGGINRLRAKGQK